MEEKAELLACLEEKIESGKATIDRLKLVTKIDGTEKLIRKIQQEIRFLEKVQSTENVKKEHLQSTNLIHLNAIVARLFCANEPTNIMKPFKYKKSRLEVDIVCDGGASWIKVIARNARALTMISMGNGEYGQKSVLDQAMSYLECAKCYPHLYRPPDIIFHFAYGIEIPLATRLAHMGIIIEGDKIQCEDVKNIDIHDSEDRFSTWMHSLESTEEPLDEYKKSIKSNLETLNTFSLKTEINVLNLDVSTLLAYVTNMTNGYDHFIYREPLLTQQAEMERKCPVKPILENLFKGKELIVCQTAYENFMNIIDVIGGPKETFRAKELLNKVQIVKDISTGRIMEKLNLGGKIKDRSRLVFATGEDMKSITVSANEGFVRAARMQGIECTVFLHEPRSLSEIKEGYATKIAGNVTNEFQRCDIHKADDQCGENARCFQITKDKEGECRCELGYEFERGQCVQLTTTTITSITVDQPEVEVSSGGSSVAAGLLIPTFLIVMSVLLYFVARRYKWLQRVRHLRPNHYGNVLVTRDDDDDDDPPIP